jgi:acetyl esterase/lipase
VQRFWILASAAALAFSSSVVSAQQNSLAADAAAFGARESATAMDLSPDGNKIVYIGPLSGRSSAVVVGDLRTGTVTPVIKSTGDPEYLSWCEFVSNDRIACRYSATLNDAGILVGFGRLVSMNVDGSDVKELGERGSAYDARLRQFDGSIIDSLLRDDESVLMTREFIPEEGKMDSNIVRKADGLGVVKINARTLKLETVERPSRVASGFMTDGLGNVRLMAVDERTPEGRLTGRTRYQYRTPRSRDWELLVDYQRDSFAPLAIDGTSNALYALKKLNGRYALYRIGLDGNRAEQLVASNPKVDIDGIVRAGDGQKVIGYTYSEDRRRIVYFEPEYTRLAAALSKALKLPLVVFVSTSADGNKVLLFAESDVDPGRYYLFDKSTKSLGEVVAARPQLAKRALAPVKAVSYPAADGTQIPAYLTLPAGSSGKGLPAVVLPHGGPSARDEWGFDWLAQFLAARGYAVIQPNYRGSSGFGDAWLGENGFKAWRTSIGDVQAAGKWLASQGIADPQRLAIVGGSYGGYAALLAAATDPAQFKAVVAVAPVADLAMLKNEARHYDNSRVVESFVGSGPHIEEGSPLRRAASIGAPVLLVHGSMDENVRVSHSRKMADQLRGAGKSVELVEFKGLDHGLEDSDARVQMLTKIGQLLERTIGK